MEITKKNKIGPAVLLVVDGWGIAPVGEGNALTQAATPNFKEVVAKYPATTLKTISSVAALNIADNYQTLGTGCLKPRKETSSLFDVLEKAGYNWLVISEAEKFAYATYFLFGKKRANKNNYFLSPSRKIDDYSLAPEIGEKTTSELFKKIKSGKHDFITAVLSNLDLIAHSGHFAETVKAVEAFDCFLGKLIKTVLENYGILFITSTHGHAEQLLDLKIDMKNKKDTNNPVPFIVASKEFEGKTFGLKEAPNNDLSLISPAGTLADVAPTILKILGLEIPAEMEGRPLI